MRPIVGHFLRNPRLRIVLPAGSGQPALISHTPVIRSVKLSGSYRTSRTNSSIVSSFRGWFHCSRNGYRPIARCALFRTSLRISSANASADRSRSSWNSPVWTRISRSFTGSSCLLPSAASSSFRYSSIRRRSPRIFSSENRASARSICSCRFSRNSFEPLYFRRSALDACGFLLRKAPMSF